MFFFLNTRFSDNKTGITFFTFLNNWVGRAMRNETFYWDGLIARNTKVVFHQKLQSMHGKILTPKRKTKRQAGRLQ